MDARLMDGGADVVLSTLKVVGAAVLGATLGNV